ncbi:MAG: dihydrolipoamide acetyltransferase family protein [Actinomycetota bacterium]|nr:dihydrolipoamide acetyltransferase family protein [Actinomycetota bacterium]
MIEIKMPRLSDTMEEGAIATWHKHPGDRIEIGDVLVEIETDKATMDYEAYEAGTLSEILVGEGDTVTIGTPIAVLDNGKADSAPAVAPAAAATAVTTAPEATTPAAPPAPVVAPAPAPAPARAVPAPSPRVHEPTHSGSDGIFASPLVRKLARDHDLDLSRVRGTGPGGRIIRADLSGLLVEAPATTPSQIPPRPVIAAGPIVDEKRASQEVTVSKARRVIARRLSESAQTIPHFYVTAVADAQMLMDMRVDLNTQAELKGLAKISVNDLIIRAAALALRDHPEVNASYLGDESAVMLVHNRINIGVAVASKHGLVVPVIVDADAKSVRELGVEAKSLAAQASGKGLSLDQMSGGTFTISNLGMFGVEEFTAIINPPEGAILAVGATTREAVVMGDEIVPRYRVRFTLSADHRIIDGALAAQFLRTLTSLIEHPWRIVAAGD